MRPLIAGTGFVNVAATGFQAHSVVVNFAPHDAHKSGSWFAQRCMQIAAGVPLALDEGPDYKTFPLGLFGLDKLKNPGRTIERLEQVLAA